MGALMTGSPDFVIPAKAGIQDLEINLISFFWMPASAGMTSRWAPPLFKATIWLSKSGTAMV